MSKKSGTKRSTPMMAQYEAIKREHPDCILFYRMGDFYEMFGEDAIKASKIMNIALTTRDKNSDNPIPMCGVPYHAAETYLARLIRAGASVAVCDQIEDPKLAKGLVKRAVTRVITPGTLLDFALMEDDEQNFLCAVFGVGLGKMSDKLLVGLAFIELSSADFFVMQCKGKDAWEEVADEFVRLKPREVLIPRSWEDSPWWNKVGETVQLGKITPQDDWYFTPQQAIETLKQHFGTSTLEGFGLESDHPCATAAGSLVAYLKETQKRPLNHIRRVYTVHRGNYMILDRICQRNLELTERLLDRTRQGTLLHLLDNTSTSMGARELRKWLLRPLLDKEQIVARQDAVAAFLESPSTLKKLQHIFSSFADISRLTSRISLNIANPKDLAALRDTVVKLPEIPPLLEKICKGRIQSLLHRWSNLEDMAQLLQRSLVDNPPAVLRDGGVIREGFHAELDELRILRRDATARIREIEQQESERTGIPKLKVRYNKVFGYFIEISKTHLDKVPPEYIRKQTLVNYERFITPQLKEFEEKVLSAEEKIIALETDLFEKLRSTVASSAAELLEMAAVVSELDVLMSLAVVAGRQRYVRPEIVDEPVIQISRGRHPVMEVLGSIERFVPNDVELNVDDRHLLIITGPNMAGKSTYIRQVALLVIMAQMGSYIPATSAKIGLVDRIFTRVGAADNLIEGHSTFMVEMIETANILNNATPRSLIILDEIGRGTSTFDGLALAWAIAEFLCSDPQHRARTLFATHYHQLIMLKDFQPGVVNCHVQVKEWNDQIIFLHRVGEGGTDRSFGIQVARLAGVPDAVIQRASEILTNLELTELMPTRLPFGVLTRSRKKAKTSRAPSSQPSLFEYLVSQPDPIIEELKTIDINALTPIEALNRLSELKRKAASQDESESHGG